MSFSRFYINKSNPQDEPIRAIEIKNQLEVIEDLEHFFGPVIKKIEGNDFSITVDSIKALVGWFIFGDIERRAVLPPNVFNRNYKEVNSENSKV